jgi:DNA-binding transcriptional regulator YhcF (GntR family)
MRIPDRETSHRITWMTDGLLSHGGHALPAGLMAALRDYKAALLSECAKAPWARTGQRTRYGILADTIGQQITDGEWKPGDRMPSAAYFTARHGTRRKTVYSAMHILAVRGQLALEYGAYYAIPHEPLKELRHFVHEKQAKATCQIAGPGEGDSACLRDTR